MMSPGMLGALGVSASPGTAPGTAPGTVGDGDEFAATTTTTYVACGSEDGGFIVWDLQTKETVQRVGGAPSEIDPAEVPSTPSGDGNGNGDGNGDENGDETRDEKVGDDVVDAPTATKVPEVPSHPDGHRDAVVGMDFAPSHGGGGALATSGLERDKTIKIWIAR